MDVAIIVPIFICVILPVSIVLIFYLWKINKDNKRSKILIKAIESNPGLDIDKFAESLQSPKRSETELLNLRLLRGLIFTFCGIILVIVGVVVYYSDKVMTDEAVMPMILGGISFAVGLSYLIVYRVSRKQIIDSSEDKE